MLLARRLEMLHSSTHLLRSSQKYFVLRRVPSRVDNVLTSYPRSPGWPSKEPSSNDGYGLERSEVVSFFRTFGLNTMMLSAIFLDTEAFNDMYQA